MFNKVVDLLNKIELYEEEDGTQYSLTEVFFDDEFDSEYKGNYGNPIHLIVKNENFTIKCMEAVGGEEQGRDFYKVYKFIDNTTGESCFVQFDGWYHLIMDQNTKPIPAEVKVIQYKRVTTQ